MNNPLQINNLLGRSQYSRLVSQTRILVALETLLQELLPDLVLAADSPVWAARLRFHAPQLVKQLNRSQTVKLRTIRIRVRPPERLVPAERRKATIHRSKNSTAALQQVAQTVSDPGLKSALLRLANRQFSR
jgi:hypothetical protein